MGQPLPILLLDLVAFSRAVAILRMFFFPSFFLLFSSLLQPHPHATFSLFTTPPYTFLILQISHSTTKIPTKLHHFLHSFYLFILNLHLYHLFFFTNHSFLHHSKPKPQIPLSKNLTIPSVFRPLSYQN